MSKIDELVQTLDRNRPVVVQAHDFPDHDAVGAAFALHHLMEMRGVKTQLCYGGEIQSESLRLAVTQLEIPIVSAAKLQLGESPQVIVVDGFSGNSNIAGLPGEVVGVIDHHPPPTESVTDFTDIRPEYGACSTILYEYYREIGAELEESVATGLLMGLMMDTAFMTRGVSQVDLDAFREMYMIGDWQLASKLLKNSLALNDLSIFREAIDHCVVARNFCFVPLQSDTTAEVTALVADFFLTLREIQFVVVVSGDRDSHRVSVRSENDDLPADVVIHRALAGVGSGGGHIHMGGGSVPRELYPGHEGLRKRFLAALGIDWPRTDQPEGSEQPEQTTQDGPEE